MEIAVCRAADVALLDQYIGSPGAGSTHARRFACQETGGGVYLVAWLDGRPVGHGEVIWDGCAAPEVRAALPGCPELNGLAVWPPELRSLGIGSALIRRAEELAREHGRTVLGLGVAADNPRAAGLYARLGYRPLTDYVDRWSYEDRAGVTRECVDPCTFLTKELPSGHRAKEAPSDHRAKEAPSDHRAKEAPSDRRAKEAPSDHRAEEAPSDHLTEEPPSGPLDVKRP